MSRRCARRSMAVLLLVGAVAAACGSRPDPAVVTVAPGAAQTTSAGQTPAPSVASAGVAAGPDNLERATVRVVASGLFVNSGDGGPSTIPGNGAGFIIDASGLVITSSHVVGGASGVEVFVSGTDDSIGANVLGVSECAGLAVLEIDGDGYPFLAWAAGDPVSGSDVFSAGFAASDHRFSLSRGTLIDPSASGETPLSSLGSLIEHDAAVTPDDAGGPLVDAGGMVIGINHVAGTGGHSYLAIPRAEAVPVIDQLAGGEVVSSVGINGRMIEPRAGGAPGVWVVAVQPGSAADVAGVVPGDVVTRLDGVQLGAAGTMAAYCDVLRSRGPSDSLAIEVRRDSTGEMLEGWLHGPALEPSFSISESVGPEIIEEGGDGPAYADFVTVSDESGVIRVDVPADWSDIDGRSIENFGPSITAAPSVQAFYETWETPGVEISASSSFSPDDIPFLLDSLSYQSSCSEATPAEAYEDALYGGQFQVFDGCGGLDTAVLTVAAAPEDGTYVVVVTIQVVSAADVAVIDRVLESFVVVGDLSESAE